MAGFWDKLRGKASDGAGGGDPLAALLTEYPPWRMPHPGDPTRLSKAERAANLADFVARRDERLGVVGAFLGKHGIDTAPMLDPEGDGPAAARAIDAWLTTTLPQRPLSPISGDETPNPPDHAFRASDRTGADIYYSLLADLGLLEGEAIRRRDDRFDWAIDDAAERRDMPSFGRVCLIKPAQSGWEATILDCDQHLLGICHARMAPGGDAGGHHYGELLGGAIRRAFDPR